MSNRDLARAGEELAAQYLQQRGCLVLARNWRCPHGEVDIIAKQGDIILFVEVKTRQHHPLPAEAVGKQKQNRLRLCAQAYLDIHALDSPCRFDVIEVYWRQTQPQLRWLQEAFE